MTFGRNVLFNVSVIDIAPAATTLQSFATFDGVTFMFDRDMPVGVDVRGEPFVVSDQAFSITSISPVASDIRGDGFVGNGAMKNPSGARDVSQGFDGYLGAFTSKPTFEIPYDTALNVDPAINGNIPIARGEKATIVKSVRSPTINGFNGAHQVCERFVRLTILDVTPAADFVRPGAAGTTKTLSRLSDVGFASRGLATPSNWPGIAAVKAKIPSDLALYSTGEKQRRLRLDTNLAAGTTDDGYSTEIVDGYAEYVSALHLAATSPADRQEIIATILAFSADVKANLEEGVDLLSEAGQGAGLWLWVMAEAALTQNDALHTLVRENTIMPDTAFWIQESLVGVPRTGKAGSGAQTYYDEQVGVPHVEPDFGGSGYTDRYLELAAKILFSEAVSILGFTNGPNGWTGEQMLARGGPVNDPSNPWAALQAFCGRYRKWNPIDFGSTPRPRVIEDVYDLLVADGAIAEWTGKPDQIPAENVIATPGNGQITVDVTAGFDFATETVTQTDIRVSPDEGKTWLAETDVTLPYTKTGLLRGQDYLVQVRRASASGTALWSETYPNTLPPFPGHRNQVTTTGTAASAAPVNVSAPSIVTRLHPGWVYETWKDVSGTLDVNDVELAVAVGDWSGFPAPTFVYQWKRNGVNIPGATGVTYIRTAADAGTAITCDVTAINSQGSVLQESAAVVAPALQNPPAGTLIDTDFRGAFAIDYQTEQQNLTGSNAEFLHLQGASPVQLGENFGAIHLDKTGGRPTGNMALSRSATLSAQHSLVAEVAIVGNHLSDRGPFVLRVREQAGDGILLEASLPGSTVKNADGSLYLWTVTGQFTTGASNSDLYVQVQWDDSTGGSSGGDMYLMRLRVAEV